MADLLSYKSKLGRIENILDNRGGIQKDLNENEI